MTNKTIEAYNALAEGYDNNFKTPQALEEDALLSRALARFGDSKNILDVGSGTGHLLELCPSIQRQHYVGVEPSDGMAKIAQKKYPEYLFLPTEAEGISTHSYEWADIVYYGYGSACYSNLATLIENYALHCKKGTELIMMLYATNCGRRTVLVGEDCMEYDSTILERIFRRWRGILEISIKPFISRKFVAGEQTSPQCNGFNDAYWLVVSCKIINPISNEEKEGRKELEEFICSSTWKYAKTYDWCPHEYIIRNNTNTTLFERMVIFIRKFGYVEQFGRKKMTRYNFAGQKYWTMGNPLEETTVINRAIIHIDKISAV